MFYHNLDKKKGQGHWFFSPFSPSLAWASPVVYLSLDNRTCYSTHWKGKSECLSFRSWKLLTEKLDLFTSMASHCIVFPLFLLAMCQPKSHFNCPYSHSLCLLCYSHFEQQVMETRPNLLFVLLVIGTTATYLNISIGTKLFLLKSRNPFVCYIFFWWYSKSIL